MKISLCTLLFMTAINASPQKKVDVGQDNARISSGSFYFVGQELVSNAKYSKLIEGTPYFRESWMSGSVIMSKGFRYDSVMLRLDLLDNTLQFINPAGKEMIATSPVRTIILLDSVTGRRYTFDNASFLTVTNKIEPGWYQLLVDGQATLYKKTVKRLKENQPYSSATVEQTITEAPEYYLFYGSVFTRIKRLKDLPAQLNDKKDELNKLMIAENLSGKSDADFSIVIEHYNTLITKQ